MGLDFETSISGAATAISNVGPGLGEQIGPSGNFSTLPFLAKWILCAAMILEDWNYILYLYFYTKLLEILTDKLWQNFYLFSKFFIELSNDIIKVTIPNFFKLHYKADSGAVLLEVQISK